MDNNQTQTPATGSPRRRLLALVIGAFVVGGAAWGGWWATHGRFYQNTDDAYVAGNQIQVTPRTNGTILAIHADDTQLVRQGDVLVELDSADARLAVEQAEAALARVVREVHRMQEDTRQLAALVAQRQTDAARAEQDVDRRARLIKENAVSQEEYQHSRDELSRARDALIQAQHQLAAARAQSGDGDVRQHPLVAAARAQVEQAYLDLSRCKIRAAATGYVARRAAQVGQKVNAGAPLMYIVPQDQIWVEANLKEDQLKNIHAGEPVSVTADVYGGGVLFHGRVEGVGAGTGSVFSLLPAQNASGNWIKVVQRVPVRVELDPKEIAAHPLRLGLSVRVDVDTHHERFTVIPPLATHMQTPAFDNDDDARVKSRIEQIVRQNLT